MDRAEVIFMFQFYKNYMEFFFIVLMAAGLLLALLVPSAALSYALIFFAGMFAGRVIYDRKGKIVFPFLVIIAGFLFGYILGANYGGWLAIAAIFVIGTVFSYKLFDKNILKDFRF